MANDRQDTQLFLALGQEFMSVGMGLRFVARGNSMEPTIRDGDLLQVLPVQPEQLKKGDIVLFRDEEKIRAHRLMVADQGHDLYIARGDAGGECDAAMQSHNIIGKVVGKEQATHGRRQVVALCGPGARLRQFGWSARGVASQAVKSARQTLWATTLVVLLVLFTASSLLGQVAVDSTTSTSARITGATPTLTLAHTTAGTNRLLVVGVSINLTNSATTKVSGISYNGVALSQAGAHNDTGNTRRVEMWTLVAPPTGNHNVVITFAGPGTGSTVGTVIGATTFTGVDQTVPTMPFVSADGANAQFSALDVSSVTNGMIIDTLAVSGNVTVTLGASQTLRWSRNSGTGATLDARGTGSTRAGAPAVPISEDFSTNTNWSLGALSLNPLQADMSVTASGSSAFFPQNLTYSITLANNGTSAAAGVTLTDTVAPGLTIVSAVPTQGTCTIGFPINCNIGTVNSGASAGVVVTVTPSAIGGYPNTATVAATTPDLNTGNNTATSVAFSQSNVCSNPSSNGPGGTLTGTINTYYPATASAAAGAKSIVLGTSTGATTPIAVGDLLLVIQMQDAAINSTNTSAYGDGSTGSGFTSPNSTGLFEFVTATSAVPLTGGTLNLNATGPGGGLLYSYTNAAATGTQGQRKFQVVRVPQYSTATLSSGLTARAWNGTTGGILAMDVAGALNLGSATVNLDGLGFRGGAGMQLNGGTGNDTDYRTTAPTTYTGGSVPGVNAPKAEGIAGTPRWVESGGTFLNTGAEGYPNGSMARGAPGNAGGGGTDGDPAGNDENAGGGGGGNGGAGGSGGDSWNSNLSSGGLGGAAFPASITRLVLGGGGGAGTRNNSDGDTQASSGSAGGGIVFIRAGALTGTATISANGAAAYNGTANDAGGGGGAGGSIVVLSFTGGESGLTLSAHGGRGGDAWDSQPYDLTERHGPGGGGAGGVVLVSAAPATIDVSGGANGTTLNPGVPYGATPGDAGTSSTNVSVISLPGDQSGAVCTSDLTITKSHVGTFNRGGTGNYTITVSNISPNKATTGLVTVSDTLPTDLTPTAATGTGWTCGIAGQTVTCTRSDALAVNSSYPAITVTVSVSQTAANQVTNTGTVAGGAEQNTTNDTASDLTNIVSSSDVAVTKDASPNPVLQGANFTYTLTVTNNGPTDATNVTTSDTLPSGVTYVSATPSQGTCTLLSTTVTCNLGTITSGATATVNIVVTAGAPGQVTNTATVTADQPDPSLVNNTSTQVEIIVFPTHVNLQTFTAESSGSEVTLFWKTGTETHNIGFNVYREANGQRVRLNPSVIAGAALTFRASLQQQSARSYAWMDRSPSEGAQYWLEDIDLDGTRTMHGPVSPRSIPSIAPVAPSRMISQLNVSAGISEPENWTSHVVESHAEADSLHERHDVQFQLAGKQAVKIGIKHAGWYRVSQPELVAAGLDSSVDPAFLRLYAGGTEQPIEVIGATSGRGGFGANAAIQFYALGADRPHTDTRVYWLVADSTPGKRIRDYNQSGQGGTRPVSFPETIELKQRTTYFAALLRSGTDNFFGALVSSAPVDQVLTLAHIASTADEATLTVVLQGVTDGPHDVAVSLNGSNLGNMTLNSQDDTAMSWQVPIPSLLEGANTVTLTAQGGDNDLSLVDYITIAYPHTYTAESDTLTFTANAGDHVVVDSFRNAPAYLIDITRPLDPVKLKFDAIQVGKGWALDAKLPWAPSGTHTLLALTESRVAAPFNQGGNRPSNWHATQPGADIVMIANPDFIPQLAPLVRLRQSQGKSVAVVDVTDLYDEFTFGERTPDALREFLRRASTAWQKKPQYLLLVGDASVDPRNYLGFGFFDFVPTQIIPTSELKTASDDWFTDFSNTGFAQIPTGRLPARTTADAANMVKKIVAYEGRQGSGNWTNQALVVADVDDATVSFTQEAQSVQALLPPSLNITDVFATGLDPAVARQEILDAINSGKLLVNYNGHGSIDIWSGEDLFDDTAASSLTNGSHLPVFVIMNCLNGFFHDVYTQSLAEALMLASDGGAVAVWASSALTADGPQLQMDQSLAQNLFSQSTPTLGEAIAAAKQSITDTEVRQTFILFGDPALRLKGGTPSGTTHK